MRSSPQSHTARSATDALAVTAVSPSLAGDEEADCRALAQEWGLALAARRDGRDGTRRVPGQRHRPLLPLQERADGRARADRSRAWRDRRPRRQRRRPRRPPAGQRAAAEAGASSRSSPPATPRTTIRAASAALGLRTWDKPAAACLASRIPYGTEVSVGLLSARSTAPSRRCAGSGFVELRVRHYGDTARLELGRRRARRSRRAARRDRRRRREVRLPLRHARPRGLPLRQPQRRPPHDRIRLTHASGLPART